MSSFIVNVAFDCRNPRSLARFWAAALELDVDCDSEEVVRLKAQDPRGVRRLIFWHVPEPKIAKSRIHIDLATKTPDQEIDRLVSLGAAIVQRRDGWTVMSDPEGNEFCLG